MNKIHHALVLNLHQPSGNLQALLDSNPWETHEILYAIDRIPRSLWGCEDVACVHLSFSGTLLETLADPGFQSRVYGVVDCGSLLWHFQNVALFNILGTGYYHPLLPLIPKADRAEQLRRWQGIACHLFWRSGFQGFWPPEMGFDMELIPLLKRLGYRYVLVDSDHVEAVTPMAWHELRYRPHIARYGDDEIIVVVRDRELSDAQESGMDFDWLEREMRARTQWCDFAPLVTTASDGDNGGWFRNPSLQANFWGFYRELLDYARSGVGAILPSFIDDYLNRYGAFGEVRVNAGAWNTGWHNGQGFLQWTGSQAQKDALQRISITSDALHDARERAAERLSGDPELAHRIEQALWRLLRAETSCNVFWGEAWVPHVHNDLDACWNELNRARACMTD
ncbi:MAG: glycoside hydrolase family 57 [Chromatiales bacterium]|jgi:alpha-amylase/alpha-mannosidase (GH57 family)